MPPANCSFPERANTTTPAGPSNLTPLSDWTDTGATGSRPVNIDVLAMKLTGSNGSAYSWIEQEQLANGTYHDKSGGKAGNLTINTTYEVNGVVGLANGTIVFGFPGYYTTPTVTIGINQTGNGSVPQIDSIYLTNAVSGNYTLAYAADNVTFYDSSPIDFNANATVFKNVVQNITGLGNITVTGNGTSASPFLVTHLDDNDGHTAFTSNATNLIGSQLYGFDHSNATGYSGNLTIVSNATCANGSISLTLYNVTVANGRIGNVT